jgi:hypothetical protein
MSEKGKMEAIKEGIERAQNKLDFSKSDYMVGYLEGYKNALVWALEEMGVNNELNDNK